MGTVWTLTMNPALDVSTDTPVVEPGEKLRCGPTRYDPGGGGVNVCRVLDRLGCPTHAIFVAGGLTGDFFTQLLEGEGVSTTRVSIEGETRESFTVLEHQSGKQYRFVLTGPTLGSGDVTRVENTIIDKIKPGDWLVGSGSLPPGVPEDFYGSIADTVARKGARVVVDAATPWLGHALRHSVSLVKPSRHELEEFLGRGLDTRQQQVDGARELITAHGVEAVAVSLGADGALFVTHDDAWHALAPRIQARSAVGAGDSFLAGLIAALHRGDAPGDALAFAVASGSAAAMSDGTQLSDRQAVESILPTVVLTTMGQ